MGSPKEFQDNPDTYVFTTRFVIEKISPLIFVFHDEERDWHFLSEEGPVEKEAKLILLSEMIEHDPTVLEIADLPLGFKAYRDNKDSPWRVRDLV